MTLYSSKYGFKWKKLENVALPLDVFSASFLHQGKSGNVELHLYNDCIDAVEYDNEEKTFDNCIARAKNWLKRWKI